MRNPYDVVVPRDASKDRAGTPDILTALTKFSKDSELSKHTASSASWDQLTLDGPRGALTAQPRLPLRSTEGQEGLGGGTASGFKQHLAADKARVDAGDLALGPAHRHEAGSASSWGLEFTCPQLEGRFCDFLARGNFVHSLVMHLFYLTGVELAFVFRSIHQAPPGASDSWDCGEQKQASLLLPTYPCGRPAGKQLRHILRNFLFYSLYRPLRLGDWGAAFNFLFMLLIAAWLAALAATGAAHRPAGRSWRAWLRWRAAALTVTPLQSWCVAVPVTVLLAGPRRWWRLGSYELLVGVVRKPVWDTVVMALLAGGMRLRVKTMAWVSLLRAATIALLGAHLDLQNALQAAAAAATAGPTSGRAASANQPAVANSPTAAVTADGAMLTGPAPNSTAAAALPLSARLMASPLAAWVLLACRHLAVLLPLACLPLAYWWWSERALRARFLAASMAAAAAAAAQQHQRQQRPALESPTDAHVERTEVAGGDVSGTAAVAAMATACAPASPETVARSNTGGLDSAAGPPPGANKSTRVAATPSSSNLSSSGVLTGGSSGGVLTSTSTTMTGLRCCWSHCQLSQLPSLTESVSAPSPGSGCVPADGTSSIATNPPKLQALEGVLEPAFTSAESVMSWLCDEATAATAPAAASVPVSTGSNSMSGDLGAGFITSGDDAGRFVADLPLHARPTPPPSAAATTASPSPPSPGAPPPAPSIPVPAPPWRLGPAPLRGTLQTVALQVAPRSAAVARRPTLTSGVVGVDGSTAAVSATPKTPAPGRAGQGLRPELRYRAITRMQTVSIKVHNPTGAHQDYAARLTAAVAPLLFPPSNTHTNTAPCYTALAPPPLPQAYITAGPASPAPALATAPSSSSPLMVSTAASTAESVAPAAVPYGSAIGGSTAFRSGGFVVVEGCVQLIAWVRGVDGQMTQQVVELSEELAAAMGLDAAAVAALVQQQQGQEQPPQQPQKDQAVMGPQLALTAAALPQGGPSSSGSSSSLASGPNGLAEVFLTQVAPDMPYASGSPARLPVLATAPSGGVAGIPAGDWLSAAAPAPAASVAEHSSPPQQQQQPPAFEQVVAQFLPDASHIGPWTVQGPTGQLDAFCNQQPKDQLALGDTATVLPPPSFICGSTDVPPTSATATVTAPALSVPTNGGISGGIAPPLTATSAAAIPVVTPSAASTTTAADDPLAFGAGPITVECAWTPCVPIAPAASPPIELELGLTSAVAQTLRLLLVRHGVLLADFTCVLGEGAQVLLLPVPPQPRPAVLQLVFAPAAGAATANSPLLYDIATLLSVPDEVAAELAQLSQVMRMEYGSTAATSAAGGGGAAAWRDHYAPLISDLAYLMERAELAEATRAGGAAAAAPDTAALAAAAAADGPAAVLRVAQQLIHYLQTNDMPATAQFVVRTAHEALQLHLMLAAAGSGAAGTVQQASAALPAAPAVTQAAATGRLGTGPGVGAVRSGGGGVSAGGASAAVEGLLGGGWQQQQPQRAVPGQGGGHAATGLGGMARNVPAASDDGSDSDWEDCQSVDSMVFDTGSTSGLQRGLAAGARTATRGSAGSDVAPSSSSSSFHPCPSPSVTAPVAATTRPRSALYSPFAAVMAPWPDASDEEEKEGGHDGDSSKDGDVVMEEEASGGIHHYSPETAARAPINMSAVQKSPFAAAMAPWSEEDTEEAEEAGHGEDSAADTSLSLSGAQPTAPVQAAPQPPVLKLPAGLPTPFSSAMAPSWGTDEEEEGQEVAAPTEKQSSSGTTVGTAAPGATATAAKPESPIKLPAGLYSPFAAAMAPWPSSEEDEEDAASEQQQHHQAPAGIPASPFSTAAALPAGPAEAASSVVAVPSPFSTATAPPAEPMEATPKPGIIAPSPVSTAAAPSPKHRRRAATPAPGRLEAVGTAALASTPVCSGRVSATTLTATYETFSGRTTDEVRSYDMTSSTPLLHAVATMSPAASELLASPVEEITEENRDTASAGASSQPSLPPAGAGKMADPGTGVGAAPTVMQRWSSSLTKAASALYTAASGLLPARFVRELKGAGAGASAVATVAAHGRRQPVVLRQTLSESDIGSEPSCGGRSLSLRPGSSGAGDAGPSAVLTRSRDSGGATAGPSASPRSSRVVPWEMYGWEDSSSGSGGGGDACCGSPGKDLDAVAKEGACCSATDASSAAADAPMSPFKKGSKGSAGGTASSPGAAGHTPALRLLGRGAARALGHSNTFALMSGRRVLQALRDCCLGFGAEATGAGVLAAPFQRRDDRAGNGGGCGLEASYGLYLGRQALALDGYTLAYISAKAVVCLIIPYVSNGGMDLNELLFVGPHLLLRILSFAPKAILTLSAACTGGRSHHVPRQSVWASQPVRPGSASAPPPDPLWAVAWRESWVLMCEYVEMAVLVLPMALGLVAPPGSLVTRLRGLGLEVLMDGIQRNAFDQVRTWRRLPLHTLHCALLYLLSAYQLHLPHALARALLIWLAGFITCLVVEVPRRVDFATLHYPAAARAALPLAALGSGYTAGGGVHGSSGRSGVASKVGSDGDSG